MHEPVPSDSEFADSDFDGGLAVPTANRPTDVGSAAPGPTSIQRTNYRHLVADIVWFGLAMPATARFLPVYAIRLDASPLLLGWLAALPAIIALATSSLAGWWRQRHADSAAALFWPALGGRLAFLLPACTPFFPREWQPLWLIIAVALPAIPQGIASVVFLVLMREGVSQQQMTRLISRRSLGYNLGVGVGTLFFGVWLALAAFPLNYQVMFVAAFALSLASMLHALRVVPVSSEPLPAPDAPAPRAWRSPDFRQVALVTALTHAGFFALVPVIPLRLVDDLGAGEDFLSIFAVFELGAAVLMASQTDRIVGRIGSRPTIALGMIVSGLATAVLVVTGSLPLTLLSGALSGGGWTMTAIAVFGYFSETTPGNSLTRFSTVWNQVIMLSIFVGPMLGSQLASTSLNLVDVLLIGTVIRLVVGVVVLADRGPVARRLRLSRRAA